MAQARPSQRQWVQSVLEEYQARLIHYAERITGDPELARDVVQYAFMRLCEQLPADEEHPEGINHVGQWLYAVCRNRAVDLLRKGNRMQYLDEQSLDEAGDALSVVEEPGPHEVAEQHDSAALLRRILQTLPAAQQEIIELWAQGFSYKEISEITGRTQVNVRVIIHRAFKMLREHPLARSLLEEANTE